MNRALLSIIVIVVLGYIGAARSANAEVTTASTLVPRIMFEDDFEIDQPWAMVEEIVGGISQDHPD